ncbi:hypothetical protein H6G76_29730 [Nostoc sp. FACHB-152]|uniref:hypothetical protein n=1 Tax=Nostoc sp. FACHB-152 TaxID=2692837 RepID=UPI0016899AD7|nr:hypothetical protein [Nostoc sp. FACHB-152]MBD2451238.1 hypothetical protein [Nostoc sp. FACHB-152]
MKFEINQIVEIVDDKAVILSTEIRVLTQSTDLYSLAKDYIEEYADYEFVQRNQYSGYRIKSNKRRRYIIVLIPQQDRLIICSQLQTQTISKLFPYLWETVINSIEELRYFFELWNHQEHEEAKA